MKKEVSKGKLSDKLILDKLRVRKEAEGIELKVELSGTGKFLKLDKTKSYSVDFLYNQLVDSFKILLLTVISQFELGILTKDAWEKINEQVKIMIEEERKIFKLIKPTLDKYLD